MFTGTEQREFRATDGVLSVLAPYVPSERRVNRRYAAIEEHGIVAGRVKPGFSVLILDVSAGGICVETSCRLLPGTTVEMQLHAMDRRTDIRGRVLRSAVARLSPEGVRYRGAIEFDQHLVIWSLGPTADVPLI